MGPYVGVWSSLPSGGRAGQAALRKPARRVGWPAPAGI